MNIELSNLLSALHTSWAADTAYKANDWSTENPARGQCVVTALIVQDYFGGELIRYHVQGDDIDETHYINLLSGGATLDATASQYKKPVTFSFKPVRLEGFESIRDKRLADADTRRRYRLLRDRVKNYLATMS